MLKLLPGKLQKQRFQDFLRIHQYSNHKMILNGQPAKHPLQPNIPMIVETHYLYDPVVSRYGDFL
jgi:hypothetical protein